MEVKQHASQVRQPGPQQVAPLQVRQLVRQHQPKLGEREPRREGVRQNDRRARYTYEYGTFQLRGGQQLRLPADA
jgi:hypothetical protein